MKIKLFDDMDNISDMQLENDLRLLPRWRRAKAHSYRHRRDRILCAKAYLLLCRLLEEEYGITAAPEFTFLPKGKPLLKNAEHIHFNLSHCPKGAVCTIGDSPLGCDIESLDMEPDEDLLERCCSLNERRLIASDPSPTEAFAKLWTQKEAFLKLSGEGLTEDLPGLLESDEAEKIEFHTYINKTRGYAYTICRYKADMQ